MSRLIRYRLACREGRQFRSRNNRAPLPIVQGPKARRIARQRHRQALRVFDQLYVQRFGARKLHSGPAICLEAPAIPTGPIALLPAFCGAAPSTSAGGPVLTGDVYMHGGDQASNVGPVSTDDVKNYAWKNRVSHAQARADLAAQGKPLHPKVAKALRRDTVHRETAQERIARMNDELNDFYHTRLEENLKHVQSNRQARNSEPGNAAGIFDLPALGGGSGAE